MFHAWLFVKNQYSWLELLLNFSILDMMPRFCIEHISKSLLWRKIFPFQKWKNRLHNMRVVERLKLLSYWIKWKLSLARLMKIWVLWTNLMIWLSIMTMIGIVKIWRPINSHRIPHKNNSRSLCSNTSLVSSI